MRETTTDAIVDDRGEVPDRSLSRRRALSMIGLGGIGLVVAGCSSTAGSSAAPSSESSVTTARSPVGSPASTPPPPPALPGGSPPSPAGVGATTSEPDGGERAGTPEETAGPFPADGTNSNGDGAVADVLGDKRSVRSDIRADLDGSNTQDGVPLTLNVAVSDASGVSRAGVAVYVWHCTKDGIYSQYNSRMLGGDFSDHSYLRGVQIADAAGNVTFTTILPGRYTGRAFHIHFEVFTDGTYAQKLLTSQMAIDDALIDSLYTEAGYAEALHNDTDNAADGVFADGVEHQLLSVAGDVTSGLVASFAAVV